MYYFIVNKTRTDTKSMEIMKSNLFALVIILLAARDVFSNDVEVKVGETIYMCCQLAFEKEDGLVIFVDSVRLKMLMKDEVQDLDFQEISKKYPDYTVQKINSTLCLTKPSASLADDKFKAVCKIIKSGMYKTLAEEEIILRIYEELKFIEIPPKILGTSTGQSVSVTCTAVGSPDLQVIWRSQDQGKIVSDPSSATLQIKTVTAEMNNAKYTCEASTSIPKTKPGSIINTSMTLNVYFTPDINIEMSVVHTDLGIGEIVKITVKGNPVPKLDCSLLNIKADRISSVSNDIPYIYEWQMEIFNVTEKHIGDYNCTASNSQGSITKIVTLNLKPANLKITSRNDTKYSDYYLFTWSVNSKAPIITVAVTIGIIDTVNGSMVKHIKLTGKELKDIEKDSGNQANNWERLFRYSLLNLTSDKSYILSLRLCNKHECVESLNSVYFRTQPFEQGNKYDPKTDALISNPGEGNSSPMLVLNLPLVVIQSALFNAALMLHHIF